MDKRLCLCLCQEELLAASQKISPLLTEGELRSVCVFCDFSELFDGCVCDCVLFSTDRQTQRRRGDVREYPHQPHAQKTAALHGTGAAGVQRRHQRCTTIH